MISRSVNIAVVGAGQIGSIIASRLVKLGHQVTLADSSAERLARHGQHQMATMTVDARDAEALGIFLADNDIVINACPYFLGQPIAQAAVSADAHYFDLTEDTATTAFIRDLAESANVALVPQCGLAPGLVCILASAMAARFEKPHSVKLRVGALPRFPTNLLRYNVNWSIEGLINEYCNPCEAILQGRSTLRSPLDDLERVLVDGVEYEAFNTSGGIGTLPQTLAGKVANLTYKTLRYPGHADIMRMLLVDLGLSQDRDTLRRILERVAPPTRQDMVIVFVTGIGEAGGRLVEESIVLQYEGTDDLSAIQHTTASGCVAMVELLLTGKLPTRGFVRQEDALLNDFLSTIAGDQLLAGVKQKPANLPLQAVA